MAEIFCRSTLRSFGDIRSRGSRGTPHLICKTVNFLFREKDGIFVDGESQLVGNLPNHQISKVLNSPLKVFHTPIRCKSLIFIHFFSENFPSTTVHGPRSTVHLC